MPGLHPFLVHFPVALLTLSPICEVVAMVGGKEDFSRVGWWTQLAGTIGIAAAIVSGVAAAGSVVIAPAAAASLDWHKEIAFLNSGLFALLLFWRLGSRGTIPAQHRRLYVVLLFCGLISIWVGAWLGGELVFRYGLGVGSTG
jgi:uncharacterized membrane protein